MKDLRYPNDNPLTFIEKNVTEYLYNEANLKSIANRMVKRENRELYDNKIEEVTKKYDNMIEELTQKYSKYTEKPSYDNIITETNYIDFENNRPIYIVNINEQDMKEYDNKFNHFVENVKTENISSLKNDPKFKKQFIMFEVNSNKYKLRLTQLREQKKKEIISVSNGQFYEARTLILNKEKILLQNLMKLRESRLLPNFKNSLDILLQKFSDEKETNTSKKMYDIFTEVYTLQLNDSLYSVDKRRYPDLYDKKNQEINKELELIKNIGKKINKDDLLPTDYFKNIREQKIQEQVDKINDFEDLLKNANTEYDVQELTEKIKQGQDLLQKVINNLTITENCALHHRFVNDKLNNYFRMIYFEKASKSVNDCNPNIINNKFNSYKYNLIKEYLTQQAKGLSAPLPIGTIPNIYIPAYENKDIIVEEEQPILIENEPEIEIEIENENEKELIDEIILPEETKAPTQNITTNIFNKCIIKEKILVSFSNIGKNIQSYFVRYAKDKIEGRCRNEGYIRKNSCKVITHTSGIVIGTNVLYNVVFLCDVCVPYHNMVIECYVKNKTKLGIRAVLSEEDNPMAIYISKEHHKFDLDNYNINENDKLTVSIVGYHFERNDEYISAFGLLNQMDLTTEF